MAFVARAGDELRSCRELAGRGSMCDEVELQRTYAGATVVVIKAKCQHRSHPIL